MPSFAQAAGRSFRRLVSFALLRLGLARLLNRAGDRFTLGRGEGRGPGLRRRRHKAFQVLMYHRVVEGSDPFLPGTSTHTFDWQMAYLARHFHVCTLESAVERMLADDLPDGTVAITFDDGYRDNYEHAWPILRRHGLTATVFVVTGSIGSGRLLWHDRVFRAFSCTEADVLDGIPGHERPLSLAGGERREAARDATLAWLKTLDEERRAEAIGSLLERLGVDDVSSAPGLMLDWSEVRQMSAGGIAFGSHTVTHPILSRLGPERARQEVFESKAELERRLGTPVTTFAYPNGQPADFDPHTVALLREAGYVSAVTTIQGLNGKDERGRPPDMFRLRRHIPWDVDGGDFAARLGLWRLAP